MNSAASQLLRFERTKAEMNQLVQEVAEKFLFQPSTPMTLAAVVAEARARGLSVSEARFSTDGTTIEMQLASHAESVYNTVVVK